jgi:hypothetical protein
MEFTIGITAVVWNERSSRTALRPLVRHRLASTGQSPPQPEANERVHSHEASLVLPRSHRRTLRFFGEAFDFPMDFAAQPSDHSLDLILTSDNQAMSFSCWYFKSQIR